MTNLWILAQAGQTGEQSEVSSQPVSEVGQSVVAVDSDSNAPSRAVPQRQSPYSMLIFIVAIMAMMYFILFREPRKRQKQQKQMVQSLKKNDKVRTIGGIIGTIVDVKDDEVVLKVDESNNTKIRVVSSAIGKNLTGEVK
ncbi:MAG: preprotein translocase subunit YajC [Sedimentisphaerales bacterium]|nr:preprotein translocase subunit YajC [Sedimentisphaerales bacterium]